ncbi:zinc finger, CCCH type domain-containing protein [Cryptosporidium serpentis]
MENLTEGCYSLSNNNDIRTDMSLLQRKSSSELVRRQLYKTKMCAFYNVGKCTRGNLCAFAHSVQELRPLPDLRFTRLCEMTKKGDVCRDMNCTFAHSLNDLRTTEIPPNPFYELSPNSKPMEGNISIKRYDTPNSTFKSKNNSFKDIFQNKSDGEEVFVSSCDVTPKNFSMRGSIVTDTPYLNQFTPQLYPSLKYQGVSGLSTCIFSGSETPQASSINANWINGDFGSSLTPNISAVVSQTNCNLKHDQDTFQDSLSYFATNTQFNKLPEWTFGPNDETFSALKCEILNIIGADSQFTEDLNHKALLN